MSNTKAQSSLDTSTIAKRSKAVIKLAAIKAKQAALTEQFTAAEAAVEEEKRRALIQQGLSDFLEFLSQREPTEIEGIISTAIPHDAPVEKVESVQHWTKSLQAAATARRNQQGQKTPEIPAVQ